MRDFAIERARDFAIKAHGSQMYGSLPYVTHLDDAHKWMEWLLVHCQPFKFYSKKVALSSAYLHDVLEDTAVTPAELSEEFGADMCYLIQAVTDEPGKNRKERKLLTYPKTLRAGPLAVGLKLCDRMGNTEACRRSKDDAMYRMYHKEYPGFRAALMREGQGLDNMWALLDSASGYSSPT
jgi:(p)ppGpp synthase/HD superfamily hydrolase